MVGGDEDSFGQCGSFLAGVDSVYKQLIASCDFSSSWKYHLSVGHNCLYFYVLKLQADMRHHKYVHIYDE
jgi:hypothetical protein